MIFKRKKPEIIQLHLKDEHTCLENVFLIEDVAGVSPPCSTNNNLLYKVSQHKYHVWRPG